MLLERVLQKQCLIVMDGLQIIMLIYGDIQVQYREVVNGDFGLWVELGCVNIFGNTMILQEIKTS